MFDSHHDIYKINNVYKSKINILTVTENLSSLLLQVGELQRLVGPCSLYQTESGNRYANSYSNIKTLAVLSCYVYEL